MKKLIMLTMSIVALSTLVNCSKDEANPKETLVVIERATGKMYSVNAASGELTEVMTIMLDSEPFVGIRSFVYDKDSGKGFLGTAGNADCYACLYSLDMSTGVATLMNDNSAETPPYSLDGISDLIMDGNEIMSATYATFSDGMEGTFNENGFVWFNKTTGAYTNAWAIDNGGVCCGGALAPALESGTYYTGSENGEMYIANTNTDTYSDAIVLNTDDLTPFTDANSEFTMDATNVQEFAVDKRGNAYAIIHFGPANQDPGPTSYFFVSIELATGSVTYISTLATTKQTQKHAMTFVPSGVL
jgi:hypothetical protein